MVRKYVFGRKFQCVLNTKRERSGDNIRTMSLMNNYGVLKMYPRPPESMYFGQELNTRRRWGGFLAYFRRKFTPFYVRENLYRGYIGQGITVMSDSQALGVPAETELAWEKKQRDLH